MYERILVPLDGSGFAEQALCHAESIARAAAGEIHLLSVAPLLENQALAVVDLFPVYVYRDYMVDREAEMDRLTQELSAYLNLVVQRLQASGIRCQHTIRCGQPADEIIAFAQEIDCSLVVMATHGRSGMGRWVYGSVADKVLRGSQYPILLVRVQEFSKQS